jgi:hypothetical protein
MVVASRNANLVIYERNGYRYVKASIGKKFVQEIGRIIENLNRGARA